MSEKKPAGVIPAVPTPLLPNEDVDEASLRRIIAFVLERGAHGVFVLGAMGEGAALVDREKRRVVEIAVDEVGGRVPVLAAISEVSTRRAVEAGLRLQEAGPDYLVATTPFYYKFPHPDSILSFFSTLGEKLSLPLVFYNSPGATGNPVGVDTLDRLMHLDFLKAVKDSSANFTQVMELLRRYPDKETRPAAILQGDESMYDVSLLMGADGVITGGGTVFVDMLVELYETALQGDRDRAFAQQRRFRAAMDEMLGPELTVDWVAAIKGALARKGLCDSRPVHPFLDRNPQQRVTDG